MMSQKGKTVQRGITGGILKSLKPKGIYKEAALLKCKCCHETWSGLQCSLHGIRIHHIGSNRLEVEYYPKCDPDYTNRCPIRLRRGRRKKR